jgi:hypothetical protein
MRKKIDATFQKKLKGGGYQFGSGIVVFLRHILMLEEAANPCSGSVIELIGFFRAVITLASAPGPTRAALILASVIRLLILVVRIFVLVRGILLVVL